MPTQKQLDSLGRNTRRRNRDRNPNPVTYQRPVLLTPWARKAGVGTENGAVWISMKARRILDQFSKGQGTIATDSKNDPEIEFKFLAPLNINENIVHHWEQYESVASRLAQKVRSAVKLGAEGAALMGLYDKKANLADNLRDTFSRQGVNVGRAVQEAMFNAYSAVGGSAIPPVKIDTPLYYTNSDRRQIVFDFQLYHENVPGLAPQDVLVKPIQELMKYSSPDLQGDIKIEFPYMWDVRTEPYEFIKYTTCALVGVQPTWNAPYLAVSDEQQTNFDSGYPSSCNLQLTFLDMSPLYAGTIERGSVIRVISPETAARKKNTLDVPSNPAIVPNKNSLGAGVQKLK